MMEGRRKMKTSGLSFLVLVLFAFSPMVGGGKSQSSPIEVKTFLGIPFGASKEKIKGWTVKGQPNQREVTLTKPFRNFKKAVVSFRKGDGLSYRVVSRCKFDAHKSKDVVFQEFKVIKEILEEKYCFKLTSGTGGSYSRTTDSLSRLGANFCGAQGTRLPTLSYSDKSIFVSLSCLRVSEENKSLVGPGYVRDLDAYDIEIVFVVKNLPIEEGTPKKTMPDKRGIDAL